MTLRRSASVIIFLSLFARFSPPASAQTPVRIQIDAPGELSAVQSRLQSASTRKLDGLSQLVGLSDPGPPVRVVLAPEGSEWARQVPSWIAGLALSPSDLVVIFPARSPSYPDSSLDDVLRHEIAHVLIRRASAGTSIPRWFNEGVAMLAERGWRFADESQFLYQLALGSQASLAEIDNLFSGGANDQTRAYALAGALVRDLFSRDHADGPGEILRLVRTGRAFEAAFRDVTGVTPLDAERRFWERQRIWTSWLPLLFSSELLWIAIALLAILAIWRRRVRDAEIRKKWDEEEDEN